MANKLLVYPGKIIYKFLIRFKPNFDKLNNVLVNSTVSNKAKLYPVYKIYNSNIGDYTYIADNAQIKLSNIGKFCSIGPNLLCGWGVHPTNGISTAPMFYSTMKQNGTTLSSTDKIVEMRQINIGNDVFIGMNVTILDGVTIGDGAIIGAGTVVSKDVPPYAIAIGCPMKIQKYRFDPDSIEKLLAIKWWNWSEDELKNVEELYFDNENFINKYYKG